MISITWWAEAVWPWGLLPWVGYSMVLSPPTTVGIEECKDVLGPCIQWLQRKIVSGKSSLQNKQVLIGSLFQMLFCTLIFGGQFSFPSYWENWLNSQSLPGPRDLSTNGREGCRRKWMGKACLASWNVWFLSLWDSTELFLFFFFKKNLHVVPLNLLIPGQLWLLSSSLAGQTCVQASIRDLEVVNKVGHYLEMLRCAIGSSGKAGLKPHSTAVCGNDHSLLKYLALWALNLSGLFFFLSPHIFKFTF